MGNENAPLSLREKQRKERLELLLQVAEEVFVEKGYLDTSMDEIAARVGIGTATIYSHFASKEELMVAAILEQNFQKNTQRVVEICSDAEGNATNKLTRIFHFLVSSDFFRRRVEMLYILRGNAEAQRALLARQEKITTSVETFSQTLTALIEQGKATGELQTSTPTSAMVKAFIGLIRTQGITDTLISKYSASNDEILQVYLHGIATHEQ
ncbi:TetR/AcrR family transcriptional regulator [Tengunoibacter tsumagoiensis]|uniref:TetR family transcriptional regulator n=1 Tax=Tengunoibacter tsumagoiensis TaxID=2014871 RepID=A0A402AAP0_9CHLR|nr:TetR/AcrR family transcriptional regulator [Tengunoibacter tsumagoiensis]GCE16168.1 TetR family transcriptional regulator [Tengunoibacter tsumagoiensis]